MRSDVFDGLSKRVHVNPLPFVVFLLLAPLVGCSREDVPAEASPVSGVGATPVATEALAWTGCFLPEPPPGACGEAWGPTDSTCDPDRFFDRSVFRYAPEKAPPELPLSSPLPLHWHIFLREDGSGDVPDEVLEERLARVNRLLSPAGFTLATQGVHRHRRPDLARCNVKVTPELLTDPNYRVCGASAPYSVGLDPETNINAYIVDLTGPTAFALDPCILPPGDARDGIYMSRKVFEGTDQGVLAHELGHYFGLLHTFHTWRWAEEGDDPVCDDADNDFVRDTWPQRSYLFLRDVDCANPPTTCARSGRPDQLTNIMQYSPCVTAENGTFTPGQLRRMQWKLVQERPGLLRESP